jgi:hypothetical protein
MEWLNDCSACRRVNSRLVRQTLACGYEPEPPPNIPVLAWTFGWSEKPTVCPGFTTNLPEVVEASRARLHWNKGQLAMRFGGEPTEALLLSIEVLEIEAARCQEWSSTPESQGGGAKER